MIQFLQPLPLICFVFTIYRQYKQIIEKCRLYLISFTATDRWTDCLLLSFFTLMKLSITYIHTVQVLQFNKNSFIYLRLLSLLSLKHVPYITWTSVVFHSNIGRLCSVHSIPFKSSYVLCAFECRKQLLMEMLWSNVVYAINQSLLFFWFLSSQSKAKQRQMNNSQSVLERSVASTQKIFKAEKKSQNFKVYENHLSEKRKHII